MPQIDINTSLKYILFLFSVTILFFTLSFISNKTILSVNMISLSNKSTHLHPEIYYSKTLNHYSEKNSLKSYKESNGNYTFKLPKIESIKFLRFDPTKSKNHIALKEIIITKTHWFKNYVYILNLENFKIKKEINIEKRNAKKIIFLTLGNDSQFNVKFKYKYVSSAYNTWLLLLFISLIITIIIFYIYFLYKTEDKNNYLIGKILIYSLIFSLAIFKVYYYKDNIRFGYPPDEIMHLAYIDHINKHNNTIPKFEDMSVFGKTNTYNYLNHPPLYYKLMGVVYDKNYSIRANVDNFRYLSALIYLMSFLLLLYIGFSAKLSLLSHFVYLSFISSIPMFAYLGGSISNDNLAILGGLIFIIGMKKLLERQYTNMSYIILALGIFIAFFSKFTAAILIFFALLYSLIYYLKTSHSFQISKIQFFILFIVILPIVYYQVYILLTYHSLMPSFNVTNHEAYLKSGFYTLEQYRQHLSPMQWLERMQHYIIGGWFNIHSHHSFGDYAVVKYIGLLILHIIAIISLFVKCDATNKYYCITGKIALLSLVSVLVIQYIFSYKTHLSSGYLGGLQPRYLLPFMFSFAIMASLFVERFKQYFLFTIFIILVCIHALYSDFFYFLQYYK